LCLTLYFLAICFAPSLSDSFIFLTLTRLVVVIKFVNFRFALFTPSRRLSVINNIASFIEKLTISIKYMWDYPLPLLPYSVYVLYRIVKTSRDVRSEIDGHNLICTSTPKYNVDQICQLNATKRVFSSSE
jgi:hypothetical protein